MTTIYLMRHGETDWNRQERMQGQTDCPLNDCGCRQAGEAGMLFRRKGVAFERVFSSTLKRAIRTACIISGRKEEAIETDPDLMEMGMGPYEGVLFRDLPGEMFTFFGDPEHIPTPEGLEPVPLMKVRVARFLDRLREAAPEGNTLVVAHGVTMRVLLGHLMGKEWIEGWRMPLENCSVYRTVLKDGNYSRPERVYDRERPRTTEEKAGKVLEYLQNADKNRYPLIAAIDGRCGAGKTTLAKQISEMTGYPVVHMDDYFPQPYQRTEERLSKPGGNVDHERFLEEVIVPLRSGSTAYVRPYDCRTKTIGQPTAVPASPVVIVEGSYSCHPALWEAYDLRVFLNVDPGTQMARITERNGEKKAEEFREKWIPLEEEYFRAEGIAGRCELYME